jgi:cytochrome c-type biogenesis protein CcmH
MCFVSTVAAQRYSPEVEKEAHSIANLLMSPFCPGQSLYACRSPQAEALRNDIRERLANGEEREAIIESLVEEYGTSILAQPPHEGFARLAWWAPVLVLLLGTGVVVTVLRRYTSRPSERKATPPGEVDPAIASRVQKDLDKYNE